MAVSPQLSASRTEGRPSRGYLPALDGLRAVGITLVFVHHMVTPLPFGGAVGVDIFFVLSGYLITSILLRQHARDGRIRLKPFYLRRAARLYPPLLAVMAALAIPGVIFAPSIKAYLVENLLAATYTTPIALEVSGTAAWAWRHTWSLGIEEIFYLVWPLMLTLVLVQQRLRSRAAGAVALLGLVLLGAAVVLEAAGQGHSLLLRSGGLFLGCALALWRGNDEPSTEKPQMPAWAAGGGVLLIGAAVVLASAEGVLAGPVLMTVLGSTVLLAYVLQSPAALLTRALSRAPLAYLGRISYEVYLWHYPLLIIVGWAFDAPPVAVALVVAPSSIALAALTHSVLTPRIEALKARVSR